MTDIPSQMSREEIERRERRALFMTALATAMSLSAFLTAGLYVWAAANLRSEWIEARKIILERAEASDSADPGADDRALLTAVEQIVRAAARWEDTMDQQEAFRENFRKQNRQTLEQLGNAPAGRTLNEIFGIGQDTGVKDGSQ